MFFSVFAIFFAVFTCNTTRLMHVISKRVSQQLIIVTIVSPLINTGQMRRQKEDFLAKKCMKVERNMSLHLL